MSFYGKDETAKEPEQRSLRTYTYKTWGGKDRSVEAHYIQFQPDHVSFWVDGEDGRQDQLALAEANTDVRDLKEVVK